MNNQSISAFSVIGISVRTSNENGQAGIDIPALWRQFISSNITASIPNKTDNSIYCIYTCYEKDHTKPYTCILGCRVENLKNIPDNMVGKNIEAANYVQYTATGNLEAGLVFDAWTKIWQSNIERTFTADFEIYGEAAKNPANATVAIYVAVK